MFVTSLLNSYFHLLKIQFYFFYQFRQSHTCDEQYLPRRHSQHVVSPTHSHSPIVLADPACSCLSPSTFFLNQTRSLPISLFPPLLLLIIDPHDSFHVEVGLSSFLLFLFPIFLFSILHDVSPHQHYVQVLLRVMIPRHFHALFF